MIMKYSKKIFYLATAALLMVACTDEIAVPTTPEEEVPEGMMPVHLKYSMTEEGSESYGVNITRGTMVEANEPGISNIKMMCFNNTGNFLGLYDAEVTPATNETGTIDGLVDSRTCSVHFIANHPSLVVSQSANYLREMVDVMKDRALVTDYNNKQMTYWTYHAEATAAQMALFLKPEDENQVRTIHFLRDRVMITGERDLTQAELTDNGIESIQWMVTNGLTQGYVIPWRTFTMNPDINWEGLDVNETFFQDGGKYNKIRITPYEKLNRQRYNPAANDESLFEDYNGNSKFFLFEDWNNNTYDGSHAAEKAMVKLIFKVKFTGVADPKYHVIKIMDENLIPFNLKRNHDFRVRIINLRNTKSALDSFQEAIETDQFSNDQFASVSELVHSVSEGATTLAIVGGTTKEINAAAGYPAGTENATYTVHFTCTGSDGQGISNANLQFDELDPDFGTVTDYTYDTATGEGTVTIKLAKPIPASGAEPNYGRLRILEKNSRLYRHVMFYAIHGFTYASNGTPKLSYVSGTNNQRTYKLEFTIPGNYPAGLYPITVVIGSRLLTPFSDTSATAAQGSFEVVSERTGVSPYNYPASTATDVANRWRRNGNTWDFVYKYKIMEKPLNTEGDDYSTEDQKYTIYLSDNRSKIYISQNNPVSAQYNVGLYFQIENFGADSQYECYGDGTGTNASGAGNFTNQRRN